MKGTSHMPKDAGERCAVDWYGPLSNERGGIRYILVCLDVFTKFVKLYALRAATARTCLQKMISTVNRIRKYEVNYVFDARKKEDWAVKVC